MRLPFLPTFALCTLLVVSFSRAALVTPDLQTFTVEWSGAEFGNRAFASGTITLRTSLVNMRGVTRMITGVPYVADLELTVSGASGGNGIFTLSDFSDVIFLTIGPLDLSRELVGQPVDQTRFWGEFPGSDFNLFPAPGSPAAPLPAGPFRLRADGGSGEQLRLTSFRPIPEPNSASLVALASLPILRRRRSCR